jgi:pimeloyl-ACP methyl ester carboxylesterase
MTTAQQGFAAINGTNIYYEVSGHGEPLILIHSLLMHSGMWDDQVTAFQDRYQVIRYDLSGFGQSKPPITASDADDLNALMQQLGIERAHVLGLSIGAEIALGFALAYPQRVKSLILVSSGLDGFAYSEAASQNWQNFITPVQARDFATARDVFMRQVVDGPISPAAPHVRERARQMMETYTFVNFFPPEDADTSSSQPEPTEPPKTQLERLGEISVSTLIIVGDRDEADTVKVGAVLSEKIADAQLVTIYGAAHIVNLEQPDAFNQTVLTFLAGIK